MSYHQETAFSKNIYFVELVLIAISVRGRIIRMVSLELIVASTGNPAPDLESVYEYLDSIAGPVATEHDPLKVIAPAVHELHGRARDLEFDLSAESQATKRKVLIVRAFAKVTDFYMILKGINPPTDPTGRLEYNSEVEFARQLIDILFRLVKEIGGEKASYDEPLNLPRAVRILYANKLAFLREKYPLPVFAQQDHMARRSIFAANISWILIIIFVLAKLGLLERIIQAIVDLFRSN